MNSNPTKEKKSIDPGAKKGEAKVYFIRKPSSNPDYKWYYLSIQSSTNNMGGFYARWIPGNKKPEHTRIWIGTLGDARKMVRRLSLDFEEVELFHYRIDKKKASPLRLKLSLEYTRKVRRIAGPAKMLVEALTQAGFHVKARVIQGQVDLASERLREIYLEKLKALPNNGIGERKC